MSQRVRIIASGAVVIAAALSGCRSAPPPPPPRADVPRPLRAGDRVGYEHDEMKPLPLPLDASAGQISPPFADVPLVTQAPPEQGEYVKAYRGVGGPRITLFVNRSLDGAIIPASPARTITTVKRTRKTTVGVTVDERTRSDHEDQYGRDVRERDSRFETDGPGEVTDRTETYLAPGEYDEIQARRIDYDAVETIMTDWLAAGGRVTVISPDLTRQRLTDEQVKELAAGRPKMLSEVARELDADVLIQVQAKATRQTPEGITLRIVAEAINTRGGESIARAVVDLPPPLDKQQINEYTRFLARKLMNGMTGSWEELAANPRADRPQSDGPGPTSPGSGPATQPGR